MADIDVQKMIDFLQEKWGDKKPCPMCGGTDWEIFGKTFSPIEFTEGTPIGRGGRIAVPVVPIVCTTCGNTILVSAIVSGFMEADEPSERRGANE